MCGRTVPSRIVIDFSLRTDAGNSANTYMSSPLANQVTLVTGASTGIGREIAQLLAERGARVFGTARDPRTAKPIPGVEMVRLDVTNDASVTEAIKGIVQKAG